MILLLVMYCIFAISLALMGMGVSMLEYSYYGGHHNKKILYLHIALSILIGMLWPLAIICLIVMAVIEVLLDKC